MHILPKLLLLTLGSYATAASAETLSTFGNWNVITSSDGKDLIAAVSNVSGSHLAFRCFAATQECVHGISVVTACVESSSYPILVNSPSTTAFSVTATCSKRGTSYDLRLAPYDALHKALKSGGSIGFALPLQSGQFQVVRFEVDGAAQAFEYVETKIAEAKGADTYL